MTTTFCLTLNRVVVVVKGGVEDGVEDAEHVKKKQVMDPLPQGGGYLIIFFFRLNI